MKVVSWLSQNMKNNFKVVHCTLLNKLISLSLLHLKNVGKVIIMEWMLFWNMGKEEGEAAGRHCYSSSFISMLVCLLFIGLFLSFSFVCVVVRFLLLLLHWKRTTLVWIEYRITCLFVCWHFYVQRRSFFCDHFCAHKEKLSKVIAVGKLRCHIAIKKIKKEKKKENKTCYNKMASDVIA